MMNTKYTIVIDTLKTMYKDRKIDSKKVKTLLNKKMITQEEYNYIISEKEV